MITENAFANRGVEAATIAAGTAQAKSDVSRDLHAMVARNEAERISAENNRWTQWRNQLNPGEVVLYNQGLLDYGTDKIGPGTRTVRGFEGKTETVEVEGIAHGKGTLFIPSTREAQITHGEVITEPRTSAV